MRRFNLMFISLILCMFLTIPASAGDGVTYNLDSIKVTYAAEFTALPQSAEGSNWFTNLAGGTDKPLQILYGVVELNFEGSGQGITEEYIKITGINGSESFLANSMTTGWYDGGNTKLEYRKTFFWSAKKLEGNTVVKDFSGPIKSVTLKKNFDRDQNLVSINLYFSGDGEKANQEFWLSTDPEINVYAADLKTLNSKGDTIGTSRD